VKTVEKVWPHSSSGSWQKSGFCIYFDDNSQAWPKDPYNFDLVVKATGIKHWVREARTGAWKPDPKRTSTKRPCCEQVNRSGSSRWSQYGPCGLPVKEDGMCGKHLRQKTEAKRKDEAYEENYRRSQQNSRMAEETVKALAELDPPVKANIHYYVPPGGGMGRYTGDVVVKAEDIQALIRRLAHYEEMN
jgi:hypothetical protein